MEFDINVALVGYAAEAEAMRSHRTSGRITTRRDAVQSARAADEMAREIEAERNG